MNEPFDLPVTYKNEIIHLPALLLTSAYSYQIQVMVNEVPINFERDDSANFRALAATTDDARFKEIDTNLLQAIAATLEEILS